MKLFNSLTNKVETFKPLHEGEVSMYVCGPTVYNYPHIGNARPIIVFDTFKKMFEASGYKVKYVSNYTDVDDKIIRKAKEEGVEESVISSRYIEAYNEDRRRLNADMPNVTPRVTQTMGEIISYIEELVEKGFAYEMDGDVYFRVSKIEDYGKLSNQKVDDLLVGARIDENSKKENPLDFTLWKKTEEGIRWDTKWSKGRPGWHTECVVMIKNEFAMNKIDVHGGGLDLKFPHHENEIAQCSAHDHSNLANYWLHNGMVNIDGEKMSKSVGNVIWVKDLLDELGGNVVRWMMLNAHYRAPLNLNDETIKSTQSEIEKVSKPLIQSYVKMELADFSIEENIFDTELYQDFLSVLQEDLNTPNAFKVLFEATKKLNATLRNRDIDFTELSKVVITIEKMLSILGIKIERVALDEEDKTCFKVWKEALQEKDFEKADAYRAKLQVKGLL